MYQHRCEALHSFPLDEQAIPVRHLEQNSYLAAAFRVHQRASTAPLGHPSLGLASSAQHLVRPISNHYLHIPEMNENTINTRTLKYPASLTTRSHTRTLNLLRSGHCH